MTVILLESSFPAFKIYIKRGYKPVEYNEEPVENGKVLCYQVMRKDTESHNYSDYNLNNRIFVSISNTKNG